MIGPRLPRLDRARRFFDYNVRVCAAYAQRSDTGAPGRSGGRPIREFAVNEERTSLQLDVRVQVLKVQAWRDLAVLDGEDGLDQAGDAGGRVKMTNVSLQRSDSAVAAAVR